MGFGNMQSVAVCESVEHNRHDASEGTFVVVGLSKREIEYEFNKIEDKIQHVVDARIMDVKREFI